MTGGERAGDAVVTDRGERHGSNTSALPAIGIAAKLTGRNGGSKIGGEGLGGARKDTFAGVCRRSFELVYDGVRHIEDGVFYPQSSEVRDH